MHNGFGTAAFILGIAAIFTVAFPILALPAGITGLVLGIMGYRRTQRGQADNGKLAMVGTIVSAVATGTATIIVVVAGAILIGAGVGDQTSSSAPAVTALPASAFPSTASPSPTDPPATASAFNPQPSDITVAVKIVDKSNFGDAGSVITYEPDPTLDSSAFDPNVTYQVTYEVRGGSDGLESHSFTVAGDSYTYDQEVTQTGSTSQRLTARVTSVDAIS